MINLIKKAFTARMNGAFDRNEGFIRNLLKTYENKVIKVCDVGCNDGKMTAQLINLDKNEVYGIDIVGSDVVDKRIKYSSLDFEVEVFPYDDNYFDVIFSNQVIEHLINKDHFVSECIRILKPNGMFIIATENISSLDNIISVIFGQEPLSQNSSLRNHDNSFISPHFGNKLIESESKYGHKNVMSYFSLQRMLKRNGVSEVKIKSFGNICYLIEKLLPFYNRVICVYGKK